jgi:hypothetical protein
MQKESIPSTDKIIVRKRYTEEQESRKFEALKEEFGRNKKLPEGYELQTLVALSHYPELKDIKIEWEFTASDRPLATQPSKTSLVKSGPERTYIVSISKKAKSTMQPVLLRNLPFDTQVGALGHELGHVIDFIGKNSLEAVGTGVGYMIDSYKHHLESGVDLITIRHGLAYQILGYAELVVKLQKEYPDETYYQDYFKYYMSPGKIKAKIRTLKLYRQSNSKPAAKNKK